MTAQPVSESLIARSQRLGAVPLSGGGVRFSVWAPRAKQLAVCLLGETSQVVPLQRGRDDVFAGVVPSARVGSEYFYLVDGGKKRPDPTSRHQPHGVHGPSRVVDLSSFSWTDSGWRGLPIEDHVLYELHIGTFTPDGTFDAAIERLPYLRALGVTAVEIMPVAEFPGTRNWGYDGVSLFAPHSAYGGPQGLMRFVDACHAQGMACVLDVVYNHLGPEGNYLSDYGPYFSDRYRTPWGDAINFDGPQSDGVRRFVIENALQWLRDYHIDGLRLDAVHAIYDFSARHILAELQDTFQAEAAALGRRAQLIAESDLNDVRVIAPPHQGGHGLDAQWSDDFHHALHTSLLHARHGYFADYQGLSDLAKALQSGFVYDGRYSVCRQRRHGNSFCGRPGSQLVICSQNHDQVGNGSAGARSSTLLSFEQQKLAACALLLAPNVPMLFMGQEYGETAPFHYFVSHTDPQLVQAVRTGRQRELASLHPESAFADPQDIQTFQSCKLDWRLAQRSPHAELLSLYRDLLTLRRCRAALRSLRLDQLQVTCDGDVLLMLRRADSGDVALVVLNVSGVPAKAVIPAELGTPRLFFSSADSRYLAPGSQVNQMASPQGSIQDGRVVCPPWSAMILLRDGDA